MNFSSFFFFLKIYFQEFQYGLPVNLYLYRIVFDKSKIDDEMPKMTNGWFKMTRFTMKWLQLLQIQIFKIENEAFSRPVFKTLEFLEIFDVPLRFLKSGTFNGLDKLKVLSMRGLRLDRIEKNVLATMPSLEGLSLNQCGSKIIHLDNLFGENILRVLRHINVHNCILGDTITDQTFSSIPSIESLSLNSDSIDIIAPNSLDYLLRRVKRLSLGWNKLKSVPIDLFQIDREVTIELTGNPWHCDCQLENLRIFERTTTSVKFNGLICATPEKYRGIPLRNCPFLCNEIVLPYTETDKPIQTQLITVKPEPGSQNVIQVAVNVHEKISFMCQSSTSPQKSITLTKSSHKIGAMTQIEGGQLHIDAAFLKNDFKLIEFNHFQSNEFDEIVFNNEKSCATYKRNEPHNIQIQRKLEPHVLYRFCWTEKGSVTIVPLDCNTFHLNEGDATLKDVDAWIMKSEKPIVITVCTLSAILALVIGILIAIALAKLFPTKIRGRMTDFGKSVTKNFDQIRSSKEQETFNRLRYVFDEL